MTPPRKAALDPERLFEDLGAAFLAKPGVSSGRMFGSTGLKRHGKVFAMLVKGELVLKLPNDRVQTLLADGYGSPFDPGHGRLMKEWVTIGVTNHSRWHDLAQIAYEFVKPS